MRARAISFSLVLASLACSLFYSCSEAPFDPYGGIDPESRGDINLDGWAYTIADAVMFGNYFVQGPRAFPYISVKDQSGNIIGHYASIAASDVNRDGIELGVADLVYLIRVVIGDAQDYVIVTPMSANLTIGSSLAVDAEMGAGYIVLAGEQTPILLADNMEMKSRFDGEVTRVLVWSLNAETFHGEFLGNVDNVVSVELGSAEGARVVSKLTPENLALGQNYPNPFTTSTFIDLSLPKETDYTIVISNSAHQEVESFFGHKEAGFYTFEWDATKQAAGIYYATLFVGDWQSTIKMIRL